jgi:hypothetical protein
MEKSVLPTSTKGRDNIQFLVPEVFNLKLLFKGGEWNYEKYKQAY